MKKLLFSFLLSFGFGFVFPWWSVSIAGLVTGMVFKPRPFQGFFSTFLGGALAWVVMAAFLDFPNQHLLSSRMSEMIGLSGYFLMYILTGFIGGLLAGLGGLLGSFFAKDFLTPKE